MIGRVEQVGLVAEQGMRRIVVVVGVIHIVLVELVAEQGGLHIVLVELVAEQIVRVRLALRVALNSFQEGKFVEMREPELRQELALIGWMVLVEELNLKGLQLLALFLLETRLLICLYQRGLCLLGWQISLSLTGLVAAFVLLRLLVAFYLNRSSCLFTMSRSSLRAVLFNCSTTRANSSFIRSFSFFILIRTFLFFWSSEKVFERSSTRVSPISRIRSLRRRCLSSMSLILVFISE